MMIHLFVRTIPLHSSISMDSDLAGPVHPASSALGGLSIHSNYSIQGPHLPPRQWISRHPTLIDLQRQHHYHRTACLWWRHGDPYTCRRPRYQYYGGVSDGLHQYQATADRPTSCLDAEGLGIREYLLSPFVLSPSQADLALKSSPSSSQSGLSWA
jgi:hypothetical protein